MNIYKLSYIIIKILRLRLEGGTYMIKVTLLHDTPEISIFDDNIYDIYAYRQYTDINRCYDENMNPNYSEIISNDYLVIEK